MPSNSSDQSEKSASEPSQLTARQRAIIAAAHRAARHQEKNFDRHLLLGRAIALRRDLARQRAARRWSGDRKKGAAEYSLARILKVTGLDRYLDVPAAWDLEQVYLRRRAVIKWRRTLTSQQRFAWQSARSVIRHCPAFARERPSVGRTTIGGTAIISSTDSLEVVESVIVALYGASKARSLAESILAHMPAIEAAEAEDKAAHDSGFAQAKATAAAKAEASAATEKEVAAFEAAETGEWDVEAIETQHREWLRTENGRRFAGDGSGSQQHNTSPTKATNHGQKKISTKAEKERTAGRRILRHTSVRAATGAAAQTETTHG